MQFECFSWNFVLLTSKTWKHALKSGNVGAWQLIVRSEFSSWLDQARSQDLEKGGYFERVRKLQTTLTRIFIVLESVSLELSENLDEMSRNARKFKGFFRPNSGGLQKKKRGLRRN